MLCPSVRQIPLRGAMDDCLSRQQVPTEQSQSARIKNYANGSSHKVSADSIAKLESTQELRSGIGRVRKCGSALVIQRNNRTAFPSLY
jgi:hypothetical protein